MLLIELLKKIQEDMDLTKKYPGYFKKIIFEIVVTISLILLVIVLINNDMSLKYDWIECNKESCINPYRTCQEPTGDFYISQGNCIEEPIPERIINLCGGPCPETLIEGQIIGQRPPFLAKHFNGIVMALAGLAFFINHLLWIKRGRWC